MAGRSGFVRALYVLFRRSIGHVLIVSLCFRERGASVKCFRRLPQDDLWERISVRVQGNPVDHSLSCSVHSDCQGAYFVNGRAECFLNFSLFRKDLHFYLGSGSHLVARFMKGTIFFRCLERSVLWQTVKDEGSCVEVFARSGVPMGGQGEDLYLRVLGGFFWYSVLRVR